MNLRATTHIGGYPNHCKIYRKPEETSFQESDKELVLYEGDCVFYGSGQMRKFLYGNVVKADFAVSFPRVIRDPELAIEPGDLIVVEGNCETPAEVVDAIPDEVFGMGTQVFFNIVFN